MADLTVLSTGKTFWQLDDGIAALLLEMFPAAIERANPRPKPKPADLVPQWGVNVSLSGYHHITFRLGARNEYYDGPPSQAAAYFAKSGVVVPDNIVERYTPLWRPREFEHPAVQKAYWAEYEAIHNKENK
jgi:hypothetical protein